MRALLCRMPYRNVLVPCCTDTYHACAVPCAAKPIGHLYHQFLSTSNCSVRALLKAIGSINHWPFLSSNLIYITSQIELFHAGIPPLYVKSIQIVL